MLKIHDSLSAMPVQEQKSHKHRFSDLRSPGLLARWPVIGLMMVLFGSLVFGVVAVNVQTPNSPLVQTDMQMVNSLHTLALTGSPFIVTAMISGYYLGQELLVGLGAVMALYFLFKRYWPELIMVLIGWGGETGILLILSTYFNRPRPEFAVPIWPQMTMVQPSFPSGHVFGAVMGFGLLAYLIAPRMATGFGKFLVIATAVGLCLYIGFSRVFVGHHYPSDILAGYAVAIAWAGLVYTTVELIFMRKKHPQGETNHD